MDRYQDNSGSDKEMLEVEGSVERIVFHNSANGYTVCELDTGEDEPITVVGILPYLTEGETIRAMGHWEVHSSYGRQFKAEYYEKQLPITSSSILKYLSSRTVKGIGKKTAERIVGQYGVDSFDVIENHPDWLAEIPGISLSKAQEISDNFKEQFGIRSVMMFCRDFFGPATALRIYKKWGAAAVDLMKENPYILCDEIYGIGFERADRVARSIGIEETSPARIRAGIKHVLSFNAYQNGHVYLPEERLLQTVTELLGIEGNAVEDELAVLEENGETKTVRYGGRRCVYLKVYYEAEKYTASKLDLLERVCPQVESGDVELFIRELEAIEGITYAPMQHRAIQAAVNNGVMILTGGPGTGKTTVIKAVIALLDKIGCRICLAAPTGRAAKRMSEATGSEAKTIHRLLEMEYADDNFPRFRRDENNLLEEDAFIIDETSMVDTLLIASLLKAIKPGARLILIGDSDQLPPVGAGCVLNDMIESDRFTVIKLTEIFRQAQESLIITNAHAINDGKMPVLDVTDNDFFFLRRENEEDILPTVADLCVRRLPKAYGASIAPQIQIITPSRKGAAGTELLNKTMQQVLNPPDKNRREKKTRDIVFREGDKVMQIKNNYDIEWTKDGRDGQGIFNGDIGFIRKIDLEEETLELDFEERIAVYDFSMLDELEHAWAITVHKSQGSEYPIVIIPLYGFSAKLLTRNLLYTAVTRAQEKVILVGRSDIISLMVQNNRQVKRYTGLRRLLSTYDPGDGS